MSDIKNYYKRLTGAYSKDKSITQIYDEFKCLNDDYEEFKESLNQPYKYSSYDYNSLSNEERDDFNRSELNVIDVLLCNKIYDTKGSVIPFKNIFALIHSPRYKDIEKKNRMAMYPTSNSNRPIGDNAYLMWNGFQVIDLDIKDKNIADKLKPLIFEELKTYHWFLGVTLSASGNSIHIWTKIKPLTINFNERVIEYRCNFRHKYSYIYVVLCKYMNQFGYTKDNIVNQYMDKAMGKPQQAALVPYDNTSQLNANFKDLRLDVNFETAFHNGIASIDWMKITELQKMFEKIEWFSEDEFNRDNDLKKDDIEEISDWEPNKSKPRHYKHYDRWRLANTLTALYGQDKALGIMTHICSDTSISELKGDIKTAATHNKPIDMWAINELNNKHGFSIKINKNVYAEKQKELEASSEDGSVSPLKESGNLSFNTPPNVVFNIKHNEFLSVIKDDIIKNLSSMTLLEAGAGYGKTEMVKAFKSKTLLILPFISTVKSKIEKSEVTEDWIYYYGNRKPTLDDLLSNKSMAMTIDKFAHLNIIEVNLAKFDYIVLDESHLLFTSSYRSVMSPTIQRLANCSSRVILMTGTPTGEKLFFPKIQHIKVIKEDTRIKNFEVHFCHQSMETLITFCDHMADDIIAGKKILYPSNKGNMYFETIRGLVQDALNKKTDFARQLTAFYYKKSNYGDATMDEINFNKSTGNNDLIMCSNYLSVGVDIEENSPYSVYFTEPWIAQDMEQFANRLRRKDLYIKLFLPIKDEFDVPIDYYTIKPLSLKTTQEWLMYLYNLRQQLNDFLNRNGEEHKYNPINASLLAVHNYMQYDENVGEYYVDETGFKLFMYENMYMEYAKQLKVLCYDMQQFGYTISFTDHSNEVIPAERKDEVTDIIDRARNMHFDKVTSETMQALAHITEDNIDIYKEVRKGNIDIIRGESYKEVRKDNNLYVDSIEILDRNLPIVLSLYKYYDIETIKDIYNKCLDKHNRINFSELKRVNTLANIIYNIKKSKLDRPILRFVKDARDWAMRNNKTTRKDINEFLNNYTIKYANGITGAIVEDTKFLETIQGYIKDLWKVIIKEGGKVNGVITLMPVDLLWKSKERNINIFGTIATKEFFMQELLDNIKETGAEEGYDETNSEETLSDLVDNVEVEDIAHTGKYHYTDVAKEVNNIIDTDYDFTEYSNKRGQNDRFMTKQENTSMFRDTIFGTSYSDSTDDNNSEKDNSLF